MPLDRVHAQHEATSDLAVGGAFQQQVQHLALPLGQRFHQGIGASRGQRMIRGVLLPKDGEQCSDVRGYRSRQPTGQARWFCQTRLGLR